MRDCQRGSCLRVDLQEVWLESNSKVEKILSKKISFVVAATYFCQAMPLDGRGSDTFIFGDAASSTNGFSAKSAFMINSAFPPAYQVSVL